MKTTFFIACCALYSILANAQQDFKIIISKALAEGRRHIVVPPGNYRMDLRDGEPLTLDHLSGVNIIASGVHITCNVPTLAVVIKNCKDVHISGLSIDYDPLPFTQGTITAMDTLQRKWMDVTIDSGYRTDMIAGRLPDRLQIFDPHTRQLRKNLYTYFSNVFNRTEQREDRVFRFYKDAVNPDASEMPGDKVVLSLPFPGKTRPHTFYIFQSANTRLEDVTLYAGNCFGFFEEACNRSVYNRCRITVPPAVSNQRLRSVNADALHSKHAIKGPRVTNCELLYNGDDGVAINTSFYRVLGSKGNQVYVDADTMNMMIKPGHHIRFVSYEGKVQEDAKVIAVTAVKDYPAAWREEMDRLFKLGKTTRPAIALLTLNQPVSVAAGTVVSSLDMSGAGFVVKHNRIGYTRARGILVKAGNGVIAGNTVAGCELGGIVLAPELNWLEAGFSRNVLIRNNLVKDCMFANSSYGIEQAAPISVVAVNARGNIAPAGGFRSVRIINNTIENSPLPAMMITSLTGGIVKGNRIHISHTITRRHGVKFGVDNRQPIWQKHTEQLIIKKNRISF